MEHQNEREKRFKMKCDYKGCERRAISGGNMIIDVHGNDYSVDLCAFHLKKLVPEAEVDKDIYGNKV